MKQESALCPNCGAKGIAGNKCEFCGTFIPLPVETAKENKLNEVRVAKSVRTKDIAIASLLNLLADTEDLSAELFEDIEIEEAKKYLVPFYSYKGEFQAPWTCVKLVEEKYKDGDETKTRTKRYPMNGVAADRFNRLYCACDLDKFPESVKKFITKELYNGDRIPENYLEVRELDAEEQECLMVDNGKTEETIWHEFNGDYDVERLASWAVRNQRPSKYEDDSWSYTSHREAGVKMLIPIWSLTYTSKGKKYAYVSDDYTKGRIFEYPVDEDYKTGTKEFKKQSESKSLKGCLVGILGVVFALLTGMLAYGACNFNGRDTAENIVSLFFADVAFAVFCLCFLVMRNAMRESEKAEFNSKSYDILHKAGIYAGLVDKVIIPNKFNLEEIVKVALLQTMKEKISAVKKPSLEKSYTWVWPTIIGFFVIILLANMFCIANV